MKTQRILNTLFIGFFILSVSSLQAQVYNLNQASGTISVLNEAYVDDMNMVWNINAGQSSTITLNYLANIEGSGYDDIYIYNVNSSGTPSLLLVLESNTSYEEYGTITTTIASGRVKVVFTSDGSCSYADNGYKGFKIQFAASESFSTPEITGYDGNTMLYSKVGIGTLFPQKELDVNGDIRVKGAILSNAYQNSLRIYSSQGYVELGPQTSTYATFRTDRSRYYFDKPINIVDGILSAHNTADLTLQTGVTSRMTILSSNGNVGIGTLAPSAKLHILQTSEDFSSGIKIVGTTPSGISGRIWMGAEKLHIDNATAGTGTGFVLKKDGNVGIGVADPAVKLHLAGSIRGNSTHGSLRVASNSGYIDIGPQNTYDAHIYTNMGSFIFNTAIYSGAGVFGTLNSNNLIFNTNSTSTRMTILQSNGNVGIGTSSPDYKLDVAGVIRCSEVLVQDINQIADFVFKPDYSLPSLQQVDEFISSNGHLPGIPSEAEVKEKGLGLVEMQIKLLQKVEELTLYVIEQDKRALEQEKRIKELEAELMNK